jgi:hypothetical protein
MDALAINFPLAPDVERIITPLAVRQASLYCQEQGLEEIRFPVKAMWDTGSTGCCISRSLARRLGLTSPYNVGLYGTQGSTETPAYLVDILMADGFEVDTIEAAEIDMKPAYDFIVGMNIIRLGNFALVREKGSLIFHFNAA